MNPLKQFKEDNPHITWEEISDKTGIPLQTLMSVRLKSAKEIGGVTIGTLVRLSSIYDINLIDYYLSDK